MNNQHAPGGELKRFYKVDKDGALSRKSDGNSYVAVEGKALKRLQILTTHSIKRRE